MKLDALRFGIACGLVWAGAVLCLGIMSEALNWGTPFVKAIGGLYLGYKATPGGIAIGTVWALFDGGIGGFILAAVYNFVLKLGKK